MNQPRVVFTNTAKLAMSTLIVRAGSIVLTLVIARLNHADGLGVYSAAMAYYGLVGLAGTMGATSYLVREIAKDCAKTSYYVTHLSVICVCVSLGFVALFSVALPYFGYSEQLTTAIYVVLFGVIAGVLNSIQHAVFVAHQKVGVYAYTAIAGAIVNLIVSLYLLTHGYGIVSLLVAFVIQEYVGVFVYFYLIDRFIAQLEWKFSLTSAIHLVGDIKTFAALSVLGVLFTRPEIIILSLVKDEAEVGFYMAALKLVVIWGFIPQIFMANVFPVLSRSYHSSRESFQFIQERSIKYLMLVSFPLTAGIITTSDSIIHVLYGSGFEASVLPLQFLALSIPCNALMSVLWHALAARNQQVLDLRARVISIVVRLVGGFILITSLGSLGAAIIVPTVLFLNTLLLVRYVNMVGSKLQIMRLSWRCGVAATGMGIMTSALNQKLPLWALIPLAAVVYGSLLLACKALSPCDLALFRKIWRPEVVES